MCHIVLLFRPAGCKTRTPSKPELLSHFVAPVPSPTLSGMCSAPGRRNGLKSSIFLGARALQPALGNILLDAKTVPRRLFFSWLYPDGFRYTKSFQRRIYVPHAVFDTFSRDLIFLQVEAAGGGRGRLHPNGPPTPSTRRTGRDACWGHHFPLRFFRAPYTMACRQMS